MVYDICIFEKHFFRLRSTIRSISDLWYMISLLYSSMSGTLFVVFEPEPTSQLLVRIEYEYLGEGLSIMLIPKPEFYRPGAAF